MKEIKQTKTMGRGLFSTRDIKEGEIVEESPVIVFGKLDTKLMRITVLGAYVFYWKAGHDALALGYGSLFNHSGKPNVTCRKYLKLEKIVFKANRNIKKGEQLFMDYGYDPKDYDGINEWED